MEEQPSKSRLSRRRRGILSILATYKQFELPKLIHILNTIYGAPHEEVVQDLKTMEAEALVKISRDAVELTSKGMEVIKEVGIDEDVIKNVLERLSVTTKPLSIASVLLRPKLSRLDAVPLDAEALKKVAYTSTPPKLSLLHLKIGKLDTSMLQYSDLSKLSTLISPIQVTSSRSRPKLTELDRGVLEKPISVIAKLLSIKLQSVKLVSLDRESEVEGVSRIIAVKPLLLTIPRPALITPNYQELAVKHEVKVPEVEEEEDVDVNEVAGVLELFEFKEPEELEPGFGLATAVWDRPVIIIAIKPKNHEYDYVDSLRYILRTLYRVVAGGLPQGEYFTVSKKEDRAYREAELSRLSSESSRQGIVKVIEIGEDDESYISSVFERLRNRLRELLVEGLSYTVLYINESVSEYVINKLVLQHRDEFGADIIILSPRKLSWEQMYKVSALIWGFKEDAEELGKESERVVIMQRELDTFNKMFAFFTDKYINKLREVYSEAIKKGYAYIVKPHRVEAFVESSEHYLLKVFTVYHFAENEKVELRDIKVEEPLSECRDAVPDVYVVSEGIAVEVETLYGEGLAWVNKLVQSVEKYRNCGVSEIWLIIPPLQASIFMKQLTAFVKWLKERKIDNVKLLTVDLEKKEFVPATKLGKLVKKVLRGENVSEEHKTHLKSLKDNK
jgi:hypothetical protein